jgi:hypothetical protein
MQKSQNCTHLCWSTRSRLHPQEIERLIARESNRAEMRKQRSAATRRIVSDEI